VHPEVLRAARVRNGGIRWRVEQPVNTPTTMAERYTQARGLFEHGEYQAAADLLAALVDESALEPPLHGTTELRVLLARAYFHSAQLGRAETVLRAVLAEHPDDAYANLVLGRTLQRQGRAPEARPHLAMAELLGGYAGTGRLASDRPGATE
jgi:predicted Zn-dependent protease